MKTRISLITAAIFSISFAQAQQDKMNSTSFGFRGGVNFQNINGKNSSGDKLKNDILTGFNAGVNAEIPLGTSFYLQPGLLFTTKGAKSKTVVLGQDVKSTIKVSYVELPINFLYKPMLGTGHLLLGFGPYVALGVGGKATYDAIGISRTENVKFKNDVKLNDPNDVTYFKQIDAGANILAGYEFSNKISFQLNAQLGLTDINPKYEGTTSDKATAKNTGFGLSLGYRF
jgi:Outer membrane protein beta-barrel domain